MNGLYEGTLMAPYGVEYTLYTIGIVVGFMSVLLVLLAIAYLIERMMKK